MLLNSHLRRNSLFWCKRNSPEKRRTVNKWVDVLLLFSFLFAFFSLLPTFTAVPPAPILHVARPAAARPHCCVQREKLNTSAVIPAGLSAGSVFPISCLTEQGCASGETRSLCHLTTSQFLSCRVPLTTEGLITCSKTPFSPKPTYFPSNKQQIPFYMQNNNAVSCPLSPSQQNYRRCSVRVLTSQHRFLCKVAVFTLCQCSFAAFDVAPCSDGRGGVQNPSHHRLLFWQHTLFRELLDLSNCEHNEKLSAACCLSPPRTPQELPAVGCALLCAQMDAGRFCFLGLDWLATNSASLETQAWRRFFCVCVLVVLDVLCFVVHVTDGCFCLFPFFFSPCVRLTFPIWCVPCYQFLLLHPLPLCLSWLHRYLSQASWPGCRKTVSLDKLSY